MIINKKISVSRSSTGVEHHRETVENVASSSTVRPLSLLFIIFLILQSITRFVFGVIICFIGLCRLIKRIYLLVCITQHWWCMRNHFLILLSTSICHFCGPVANWMCCPPPILREEEGEKEEQDKTKEEEEEEEVYICL